MIELFLILLSSPFWLLALYSISIQYERRGFWKLLLILVIPTIIINVVLNYTIFSLMSLDFPQNKEYTFSRRLVRLQYEDSLRGDICRSIADILNMIAPNKNHIPLK